MLNDNEQRDDDYFETNPKGGYAYSPYEEGSAAALGSGRANNPYSEGSYSHDEWLRGYVTTAKRESRGDDI